MIVLDGAWQRTRVLLGGTSATAALLMAAPAALAGPHAESESQVGGTHIHQEINFAEDGIHFWLRAEDPAGVRPFCVTLRLEEKRGGSWRGIG